MQPYLKRHVKEGWVVAGGGRPCSAHRTHGTLKMRQPKSSRAPHARRTHKGVGSVAFFHVWQLQANFLCLSVTIVIRQMIRQRQNWKTRHDCLFFSGTGHTPRAKAKLDRIQARPKFEGDRDASRTHTNKARSSKTLWTLCVQIYLKTCRVGNDRLQYALQRVGECMVEGGRGGVYHSICSSHPVFCRLPSPRTE